MWTHSEMCDWDNLSKKQKATFPECEKHSKIEVLACVCPCIIVSKGKQDAL